MKPTQGSLVSLGAALAIAALGAPAVAGAEEVSKISGNYHFSCHGLGGQEGWYAAGIYKAAPANSRVQGSEISFQLLTGAIPYTRSADAVNLTCANTSVFGPRTRIACTGMFMGGSVQLDITAYSNAAGSSNVLVAEYTDPLRSRQCAGELRAEKL